MKKTLLYYMVCLVGAVSLFACSDWFDVNPKTDVKSDDLRSEEHTSELQSRQYLVCRLLLEKKKPYAPDPSFALSVLPMFSLHPPDYEIAHPVAAICPALHTLGRRVHRTALSADHSSALP